MNTAESEPASPAGKPTPAGPWVLLGAAAIACAALAAYANSIQASFVFDDRYSVLDNPTIRSLGQALSPPSGTGITVAGRPILNLSFALNYAISGLDGWSYHALNLVIHLLAGLTLFGLVRRTLARPPLAERFGEAADGLALAIAGIWTLHPLQTESVAYLAQRAESLMGLFYLLTLYCFVRSVGAPRPGIWRSLAGLACLLGMGTKEVMVTAPLMVLLYDRTFVAGSFAEAWRRRKAIHATLACTWLLLAYCMLGSSTRGGTAGFGLGLSSWTYGLSQCRAIMLYLKLAAWPHPLVADYGTEAVGNPAEVLLPGLLLLLLVTGTAMALWRRPVPGFVGAWFFLILAPSSSVVPVKAQIMAEHRMYLPLAAVISLAATGAYLLAGRRIAIVLLALAVGSGWLTLRRNEVYRNELALWSDTVAKLPESARARVNLGIALVEAGRIPEAVGQYEAAIRIEPENAIAQLNLCSAFTQLYRPAEAVQHGEAAVRLVPGNADARINLGLALVAAGRAGEAVPHYEEALRLEPRAADVQADLGAALLQLGRGADAIGHYQTALQLDPGRAQTWCDFALALAQQGDPAAAHRAGERALLLQPDFPEALWVLGNLDAVDGNFPSALAHFRQAIHLAPDYMEARNSLANALLLTGQTDEAVTELREILRQRPDDRPAQENLAHALELQQSARPRP